MGFELPFSTRIDSRNGVANIALVGELDMATVPVLEDRLARFEGDGVSAIVLDLRNLSFFDCSAIHAFVEARDRATMNGHRVTVVGAGQAARRLFELTRTQFLLEEHEAPGVLDQFAGVAHGDDRTMLADEMTDV